LNDLLLHIGDIFFLFFHTAFTIFNLIGWAFKKTRKWHLLTIALTAFSWFFLGIWYGWGYCFCTDWHWNIRELLNNPIKYNSYIQFLAYELSGIEFKKQLVDNIVLIAFLLALSLSIYTNYANYKKNANKAL